MHSSAFSRLCYSKLLLCFPVTLATTTNNHCTSIDLLASKLVFTEQKYPSSQSQPRVGSQPRQFTSTQKDEFAGGRGEHVVEFHGGVSKTHRSDSQENIFKSQEPSIDLEELDVKGNGIKKTVEFRVV